MALTGLNWWDFFVKCRQDFHMERIPFDQEKRKSIKSSLDKFYFRNYSHKYAVECKQCKLCEICLCHKFKHAHVVLIYANKYTYLCIII